MSMTISDYFKYATLAAASYVRMGGLPLDGATFASRASDPAQTTLASPDFERATHGMVLDRSLGLPLARGLFQ